MKIIVTGSLGNVGEPLTRILVGKGHDVTVISSKPDRTLDIEALGASSAIGDVEDTSFLSDVFKDADAAFILIPPDYESPDQIGWYRRTGQSYAKAVRSSGTKRIVHLSSHGAHLDRGTGFIVGSHHVENTLNELQGANITHLRAGYFYTNLNSFIDMIKKTGNITSNYGGDDIMLMAHPNDIAAAAAEELEKTSNVDQMRYVVSDERPANEIAQILGKAIGKPDMKWNIISDEEARKCMKEKGGMSDSAIDNWVELGAAIHNGLLRSDYMNRRPKQLGNVKTEDFANEFKERFTEAAQ